MSLIAYLVSLLRVPDFDPSDVLDSALAAWWLAHPQAAWVDGLSYARHVVQAARKENA